MKKAIRFILVISTVLVCGACATKSYINITYLMPPAEDGLKGRRVFLDCRDSRTDKTIFGDKAKTEFKYFTGLFSLSLNREGKKFVVGAFDLPSLFGKAFEKRLESLGMEVLAGPQKNIPTIEIGIEHFKLDKVEHKWVAEIRYEARLVKDGEVLSRHPVAGSAERLKVFGQGDAETVLGEIFSDMVNRLDVGKIFKQVQGG